MTFKRTINQLKTELKKPLPGQTIQLAMSSIRRIREMMKWGNPQGAKMSSVLIFLFPEEGTGKSMIVLIRRPEYDGVHSGQISLPGGGYEETDRDLEETALREAHEEIGLSPSLVTVIGQLTELYIPPSNYLVRPYIGFADRAPEFKAHPHEVQSVITIRVEDLLNEKNRRKKLIRIRTGLRVLAPCFVIGDHIIWGATAMILGEFKEIMKRIRS